MTQHSKEMYEFRKQLEALKNFQGRGTELISVYITPNYSIGDIMAKLRDEYGQAANIKSKTTQQNVQGALEKTMQYLKTLGYKPPANGIAVFCGNISQHEGKPDLRIYSVIPPHPLATQFYRCDSAFVTEPLEEMMEQTGSYGLVVMDGKEATVALLKGKTTKIIKKLHSTAHQKVSKGGQSAARYSRLHTEGVEYYYKRVGEAMDAFVGLKNFKGVLLGGPGPAKEDFLRMHPFHHETKVLGVVDTGYTEEVGLRELLDKSEGLLLEQEAVEEKKLLDEFMREISTSGLATYGLQEVKDAVESGKARTVLISEDFLLHEVKVKCSSCGNVETKVMEGKLEGRLMELKCPKCGGQGQIVEQKNLIEEIQDKAVEKGIVVELVSQETHEGKQFFATFHGLGAFLRYK